MAVPARNLWVRRLLMSVAAGCGGALALWAIDASLVAGGVSPGKTYLDEILVGILVALLVLALDLYHEARLRRIREAAQLMGQLNHYIRNSLQVILYSTSMQPGPDAQEAVRTAVRRIEWVLEKLVHESALFSGAADYLSGKNHAELDVMAMLQSQPEPPSASKEQSQNKQAG
ncbi:MAG TPA: hypothetical protein VF532_14765 [Candidatus Angelobacter sp.]